MIPDPTENLEEALAPDCSSCHWDDVATFMTSGLSILSINMRSLNNKYTELLAYLTKTAKKFTFICLTEVWLRKSTNVDFEIDGYDSVSILRENRRGGGIKIYYLNTIEANVIDTLTGNDGSCERIFAQMKIPGYGRITLGTIYRPPQLGVAEFCEFFDSTLSQIAHSPAVIVGDFNIDTLERNLNSQRYETSFLQHGFKNEVCKPTYRSAVTHTDTSCLDHVIHNINGDCKTLILEPNLSDHYAVSFVHPRDIIDEPLKISFRDYSEKNKIKFERSKIMEFGKFSPPPNANEYASYLFKFMFTLMNKYFPLKTKNVSQKSFKSPWVTDGILKCIKKKHRWYRLYKQNRIPYYSYKNYCKKLRRLFRLTHDQYFLKKLDSLGKNPKKNWKLLKKLL